MHKQKIKPLPSRQQRLTAATSVMWGMGIGAAAFPCLASWQSSTKAKSACTPMKVGLALLAAGKMKVTEWRGRPIYIVHRTTAMLKSFKRQNLLLNNPDSVRPQQTGYISGPTRSIDARNLTVTGGCTHLGCAPIYRTDVALENLGSDWKVSFCCPCTAPSCTWRDVYSKALQPSTNLVAIPHDYEGFNPHQRR